MPISTLLILELQFPLFLNADSWTALRYIVEIESYTRITILYLRKDVEITQKVAGR